MRPEEKQNKENIEEKVEKLTESKNKFSLLKDEMPITTTEVAPPPLAKERGRTTRANWGKKRNEDRKPGINMKGSNKGE